MIKHYHLFGLILGLTACVDETRYQIQRNNQETDKIECNAKGGLQAQDTNVCWKVDSIIPMTGPRTIPHPVKP